MQLVIKQLDKISDPIKNKEPLIMGILNVTPDSFSDGGTYLKFEDATKHAKRLFDQEVDIIDIGGESTRPGAMPVSIEEELRRVINIITWCRDAINRISTKQIVISIDTYKSNVAQKAIEAGADIINDVSGLTMDPNMVKVVAECNCPIVIMHNMGIPATKPADCGVRGAECGMKKSHILQSAFYIIREVYTWLQNQTNFAIANGVKRENIIIDPGIGFGKSAKEDLYLIENLYVFKSLGFPILIGISRKSFIRKLFSECDIEKKSRELEKLAVNNGADIVRLHY